MTGFPPGYTHMPVKLKVVHLLRRMERIHRDMQELENLQNAIRDDRDYADRLKNSLVDESLRLSELKRKILSQIIKNPPDFLMSPEHQGSLFNDNSAPKEEPMEPEVILPTESGSDRGKASQASISPIAQTATAVEVQTGTNHAITPSAAPETDTPNPVNGNDSEKSPRPGRRRKKKFQSGNSGDSAPDGGPFKFVYDKYKGV